MNMGLNEKQLTELLSQQIAEENKLNGASNAIYQVRIQIENAIWASSLEGVPEEERAIALKYLSPVFSFCNIALNAAFLSQYSEGKEKESSAELINLWNDLDDSKVYKNWRFFGKLAALWKSSVYDSEPLQKLVRSKLNAEKVKLSGKLLRVSAVGLKSGKYGLFTENYTDIQSAVLASSAFPCMLCPIKMGDDIWTDGGIREVTPLKAAIDLGATNIDIIVCSPENPPMKISNDLSTLAVAERSIDLMGDEILSNDLKTALLYNKLVSLGFGGEKRVINMRVIRPNDILIDNSLNFSPEKIKEMYQKGYADSKKLI